MGWKPLNQTLSPENITYSFDTRFTLFNLEEEVVDNEILMLHPKYRMEKRNGRHKGYAIFERGWPKKYKAYIGKYSKKSKPGFPNYNALRTQ